MNQFIKRIKRLESIRQYENTPFLIIASKCNGVYQFIEHYCKQNLKKDVIKKSGSQRVICVNDINDYKIPDGFKGIYITGEHELED